MSHVESETESDSASQVQDQLEEEWDEWTGEDEEESDVTKSLFSNAMLPTPEAALEHDAATHGFDVRQYKIERDLTDHDIIRCINYIRAEVAAGRDPLPALASATADSYPWVDDEYLIPVIPDDPLVTYDYDEDAEGSLPAEAGPSQIPNGGASCSSNTHQSDVALLAAENEALRARLAALMAATFADDSLEDAAVAGGAGAGRLGYM
eukprot:jgi/Chrzof1/12636/Cz07g01290.t1